MPRPGNAELTRQNSAGEGFLALVPCIEGVIDFANLTSDTRAALSSSIVDFFRLPGSFEELGWGHWRQVVLALCFVNAYL